jgi:two-component system, NarL family, response regulator LiaR
MPDEAGDRGEVIRVFIADDHPVVRQGLRGFLESRPDFEVVGEAADTETTVADVERLAPDVVLLDLVMPGAGGVAATREIRARVPGTRVLVVTSFAADDQVLPAVHAGAAGYVLKDIEPSALEAAIRVVHRGEALLDPHVTQRVLREVSNPPPGGGVASLTPRELEVLRLLARGLSNRQLAEELVVSEKTVKTHVSSILLKLGVRDRTQAALLAVREGLVDPN